MAQPLRPECRLNRNHFRQISEPSRVGVRLCHRRDPGHDGLVGQVLGTGSRDEATRLEPDFPAAEGHEAV